MAQTVLNVLAQLSECLFVAGRKEERIVAKSALPARRDADPPFAGAIEQLRWQLSFLCIANR